MGRHSVSDGGEASARPAPQRTGRPKPGRHHVGGPPAEAASAQPIEAPVESIEAPVESIEAPVESIEAPVESTGPIRVQTKKPRPVGLDVIEAALNDGAVRGSGPAAPPADETVTIPAITAAVLDEPVRRFPRPTRGDTDAQTTAMPDAEVVDTAVVEAVSVDATVPVDVLEDGSPNPPDSGVTVEVPSAAAHSSAAPTAQAAASGPGVAGRSDLALLRSDSALRARVIAAALVPFLVYLIVLLVVDHLETRTFLIWIWAPLITAGVLAGLLLDAATRSGTPPEAQ